MSAAVSYPGVYVKELPSGVRTITGVATSVTAFVGWAPRGTTRRAELVQSWSDYVRKFGGLNASSAMSYAVMQFYQNGGQMAYIIRIVKDGDAAAAKVTLDGKLEVHAQSEGAWSNDYAVGTLANAAPNPQKLFRLVVFDTSRKDSNGVSMPVETFLNVSLDPKHPRHVVGVVANMSALVEVRLTGAPTDPPADTLKADGTFKDAAAETQGKLAGGKDGAPLDPVDNSADFIAMMQPISGAGGIYNLDRVDIFNLFCAPGLVDPAAIAALQKFCRDRRAFLIADSRDAPAGAFDPMNARPNGSIVGNDAINAAQYFPWVLAPDPLRKNEPRAFPPSGFVAGIYARTDATRGVWKAPAGTDASITGALGASLSLTDGENGVLNPAAMNCIRNLPVYGTVVWGARTLRGSDQAGDEWKYIPVRRTALYIEETLYRALKWVVFEPNDEPLWAQIRLNVGAFMNGLFRQGAFQGTSPSDAYFVRCDKETTTQADINLGIVNVVVGFAPLKPAEFVIVQIQQIVGQIQT